MAERGRPMAELVLSDREREELERWSRRRSTAHALALRSRIVLESATGAPNTEVAERLGVTVQTVGKWRQRFVERRADGLHDRPRPGQPRKITDRHIEDVIVRTLETAPPDGGTHWSTRKMAAASGLNQTAVSKIWRAFSLQPHRVEEFKLSRDPRFVDKVRDIVGVYLDPPERAVVLCVDEKSEIQVLDRSAPILPLLAGVPERAGTGSLFAALDLATGEVIGSLHQRNRAIEFEQFLQTIDREVPTGLEVHLILDSYATHKTPAIKKWLAQHPRFSLHFTPTSASWRDLVGNADPKPYLWTKTRINDSGAGLRM